MSHSLWPLSNSPWMVWQLVLNSLSSATKGVSCRSWYTKWQWRNKRSATAVPNVCAHTERLWRPAWRVVRSKRCPAHVSSVHGTLVPTPHAYMYTHAETVTHSLLVVSHLIPVTAAHQHNKMSMYAKTIYFCACLWKGDRNPHHLRSQ
jgi:hypothetical protein